MAHQQHDDDEQRTPQSTRRGQHNTALVVLVLCLSAFTTIRSFQTLKQAVVSPEDQSLLSYQESYGHKSQRKLDNNDGDDDDDDDGNTNAEASGLGHYGSKSRVVVDIRQDSTPASTSTATSDSTTLHILHGLLGNKTSFFDEWEVNLKSILLNAPIDLHMHLHIMTDELAMHAVLDRIRKYQLEGSLWLNQIWMTIYNVESHTEEWTNFIVNKTRGIPISKRTTLGTYYRLMAHTILPKYNPEVNIGPVLYMDSDVVVLTNLNDLWKHVDRTNPNLMYQWSGRFARRTSPNAGFIIMHLNRFHMFWDFVDKLPTINQGDDQSLLYFVHARNRKYIGMLPVEFDVHLSHGWKQIPHKVFERQDKLGIVHFTGHPPGGMGHNFLDKQGVDKYCDAEHGCSKSLKARAMYKQTWGLADYYVRVPMHLVRYFGSSKIPDGETGYPFELRIIADA